MPATRAIEAMSGTLGGERVKEKERSANGHKVSDPRRSKGLSDVSGMMARAATVAANEHWPSDLRRAN
jgi:hypothetical protein